MNQNTVKVPANSHPVTLQLNARAAAEEALVVVGLVVIMVETVGVPSDWRDDIEEPVVD